MKTKVVEDKASLETAFNEAKADLEILSEEMRTWADNMSGTALESTMKYEQVEDCASELEDAVSNLENIVIPEELKSKELIFKYTMPTSRYIGRSWRAGQISSALQAVANALDAESGPELQEIAETVGMTEFPGMYQALSYKKALDEVRRKISALQEQESLLQQLVASEKSPKTDYAARAKRGWKTRRNKGQPTPKDVVFPPPWETQKK